MYRTGEQDRDTAIHTHIQTKPIFYTWRDRYVK